MRRRSLRRVRWPESTPGPALAFPSARVAAPYPSELTMRGNHGLVAAQGGVRRRVSARGDDGERRRIWEEDADLLW